MVRAVRPLRSLSTARGCARIDSRLDTAKIGSAGRVEVRHARLLAVIGVRKTFPHGLEPRLCENLANASRIAASLPSGVHRTILARGPIDVIEGQSRLRDAEQHHKERTEKGGRKPWRSAKLKPMRAAAMCPPD